MVVVFSHTAGLTGAEAGIAGGSALLGQKLLEAVFGDQAVRTLAERARKSLAGRVRELVDAERARYVGLLDSLSLDAHTPDQLREAARRVDDVRYQSLRDMPVTGSLHGSGGSVGGSTGGSAGWDPLSD
jgi:hypothetical protein